MKLHCSLAYIAPKVSQGSHSHLPFTGIYQHCPFQTHQVFEFYLPWLRQISKLFISHFKLKPWLVLFECLLQNSSQPAQRFVLSALPRSSQLHHLLSSDTLPSQWIGQRSPKDTNHINGNLIFKAHSILGISTSCQWPTYHHCTTCTQVRYPVQSTSRYLLTSTAAVSQVGYYPYSQGSQQLQQLHQPPPPYTTTYYDYSHSPPQREVQT